MIVAIPVDVDGQIAPGWGRAHRVAVAAAAQQAVIDWQEFEVGWDTAHDLGTEGAHHARIARFLMEHHVSVVMAEHMGQGMTRMLESMDIAAVLGVHGNAHAAVVALSSPGA